jgi:hypothetical protein
MKNHFFVIDTFYLFAFDKREIYYKKFALILICIEKKFALILICIEKKICFDFDLY